MYTKSQNIVAFHYNDEVLVYNKTAKTTYSIGIQEYAVLEKYTGNDSIEDIANTCGLSDAQIKKLTSLFLQYGLLDGPESTGAIKSDSLRRRKKHTLIYGDNWLISITSPFITRIIALLLWLSFPFLILVMAKARGEIDVNTIIQSFNIFDVVLIDVILSFSLFLHEVAHAFSAKLNGAHVGEIGIIFDLFTPLAYTTICGIKKVESKYRQIKVYLAGIAINLYMAGIFLLISTATTGFLNKFAFMVFGTNFCIVLINCLLLFDTDIFKVFTIVSGSSDCRKHLISKFKSGNLKKVTAWEWLLIFVGYVIEPASVIILVAIAIKKVYGG